MAAFRCRKDTLHLGKHLSGFKYLGLLHTSGCQNTLVIQFGYHGTHAMIAQSSGMAGGRNETAAQRVHLGKRTYFTGIAEIISIFTSCQAGAGCRFYCNDIVIGLATEHFACKRRDQTAQIGTAAGTADDHVCLDTIFVEGSLSLQTDNRLMQKYLGQHRTKHIAIAVLTCSSFYCLRNCTA